MFFCRFFSSGLAEEATTIANPRYVYYRVFFEDGALPTLHPATPDDHFLGRVPATSITPPHSVDSVKRCLATHEDINHGRDSISLFLTRSSRSPMDDTSKIDIVKRTGPGSTPQEALALVVKLPNDITEWGEHPALLNHDGTTGTRCLYYRLYDNDGELSSRVPVNPEQPSLGCIRVNCVAPPYTAHSVILCISRAECTPRLIHADLFANISCHAPIPRPDYIPILTSYSPGLTQDEPMALVTYLSIGFTRRVRSGAKRPQLDGRSQEVDGSGDSCTQQ